MKLTTPEIEYSALYFGNKHDIFSRGAFGVQLADLILNSSDNTVFALDAPWGSGKTTFIKMWVKYLKQKGVNVLHFDAFQNDYQNDPFSAIAAEIYGLIPETQLENRQEFEVKLAAASLALIRGSVNLVTKLSTGGAIGIDDIESMFNGQVNTVFDSAIKSKIKLIEKDREAVEQFKIYLSKINSIIKKENVKEHQVYDDKIIFIVDELDRCRPDFALEFLERIKHIFAVDGISFLLVTNRVQINEIIRAKYGLNINPTNYLHKFISVWLSMPVSEGTAIRDGVKYFEYVLSLIDDKKDIPPNQRILIYFKEVIMFFNPSFREIERMMTVLAILYNKDKNTCRLLQYQMLIPLYCYIHVCHPHAINHIKECNFTATCNAIGFNPDATMLNNNKNLNKIYNLLNFDFADGETKDRIRDNSKFNQLFAQALDDSIMIKITYMLSGIDFDS